MNIMLLEDRGSVSLPMAGLLEDLGHQVFQAQTPADADGIWNRRREHPIHCIVADLNMASAGLSAGDAAKTHKGVLSGWIWLCSRILDHPEDRRMRSRIIIYSEYLPDLKQNIQEAQWKAIPLIPKRDITDSTDRVLREIEKIEKLSTEGVEK